MRLIKHIIIVELLIRLIIINKRIKVCRYVEDVEKMLIETMVDAINEPTDNKKIRNDERL